MFRERENNAADAVHAVIAPWLWSIVRDGTLEEIIEYVKSGQVLQFSEEIISKVAGEEEKAHFAFGQDILDGALDIFVVVTQGENQHSIPVSFARPDSLRAVNPTYIASLAQQICSGRVDEIIEGTLAK